MFNRLASLLFFSTLGVLLAIFATLSQRPLCFESKVIERIQFADGTSVAECRLREKTPYSRQFEESKHDWHDQVFSYESWLSAFWGEPQKKAKITFTGQPRVPELKNLEITLWKDSSTSNWALQKHLTEIYIGDRIQDKLLRSFVSDLYVRIWNKNQQKGYGDLVSYFSYDWWNAYERLSLVNKVNFLKKVPEIFSSRKIEKTSHYELLMLLGEISKTSSELMSFSQELQKVGFKEVFDLNAQFDFLLMVSEINSQVLNQMDGLQKRFPDSRLGVWNGEALYHVPSKSYMAAHSFRQIQADHYVWEVCQDIEFQLLTTLPAKARKVLLVKNCGDKNLNVYASYMSGQYKKFAASHPQVEFILFDIPSLNSQKDLFVSELKVFGLISNRAQFSDLLEKVGWKSLEYDQSLKVHSPVSAIESIQYFRVNETSL